MGGSEAGAGGFNRVPRKVRIERRGGGDGHGGLYGRFNRVPRKVRIESFPAWCLQSLTCGFNRVPRKVRIERRFSPGGYGGAGVAVKCL